MRFLDFIFFARPMLLLPVWTVYLHYRAVTESAGYGVIDLPDRWIWPVLSLTLLFAGTYVINQIFDIESDRKNRKLFFLPDKIISLPAAWTYYVVLSLGGLAAAYVAKAIIPAAGIFVLGIAYSVPGLRLKDRPVGGLVANAVAYGLGIPAMIGFASGPEHLLPALPYVLAIATGYVLTTIPDEAGDAATGKKTVVTCLGRKKTLGLALTLALAATVVSARLENFELALVSVVTLLLIFRLSRDYGDRLMLIVCTVPILFITLLAGLHFPVYLVFLLLTIASTRLYYKRRFAMQYPKIG